MSLCRRCWSKQWRGHPANYNHHPRWWPHRDLQNDRQRGTRVDFTLEDCNKTPLYYLLFPSPPTLRICNQTGLSLYIPWPLNAVSNSPCMFLPVPHSYNHFQAPNPQLCVVTCNLVPRCVSTDWMLSTPLSVLFISWGNSSLTFHNLCKFVIAQRFWHQKERFQCK